MSDPSALSAAPMKAMTTAPLHKNQAGQPSENGGHFASAAKAEAPDGLLTPAATRPTPAAARFAAAAAAVKSAHEAQVAAAPAAMREVIRARFPEAVTANFHPRTNLGYHYLEPKGFFDAEGERLPYDKETDHAIAALGRIFSEDTDSYESPDFTTKFGDLGVYDVQTLDITATPVSDLDAAVAELEAIRVADKLIEGRTAALRRQVLVGTAASAFPGATSVVVEDITESNRFGHDLVVSRVEDAAGATLWERDGEQPITYELDAASTELYRDMTALAPTDCGPSGNTAWRVTA